MVALGTRLRQNIIAVLLGVFIFSPAMAAQQEQSTSNSNKDLPLEDVQRFSTAIGQIKNFYVNQVNDTELFENAIRGMLSGLDPHSAYLDIDEYSELKSQTDGEFGGLGLEVGMEDGYIRVVSPIDDTPAAKAGVEPGDVIVKLNDKPVKGMTLREAVGLMRGPKGSPIELTILRKDNKQLLQITVIRDVIQIKSVKSKMLADGYAYIRISHFQAKTADHLKNSVAALGKTSKVPLKGVVLDLRNNPGGLLDSAIDVSDTFLDSKKLAKNKLIVFTKGRIPSAEMQAQATAGDMLNGIPMVVLINQGSASGSEIVAGALQDHHRAVIMGNTSFGKGSVQTVLPLDESRGVKLTTALYYTPKGRSIQAEGIKPDIKVDNMTVSADEKKSSLLLALIKESDLDNHLSNGNAKNKAKTPAKADSKTHGASSQKDEDNQPLAVSDYQLHEALNLLKALNIVSADRK